MIYTDREELELLAKDSNKYVRDYYLRELKVFDERERLKTDKNILGVGWGGSWNTGHFIYSYKASVISNKIMWQYG